MLDVDEVAAMVLSRLAPYIKKGMKPRDLVILAYEFADAWAAECDSRKTRPHRLPPPRPRVTPTVSTTRPIQGSLFPSPPPPQGPVSASPPPPPRAPSVRGPPSMSTEHERVHPALHQPPPPPPPPDPDEVLEPTVDMAHKDDFAPSEVWEDVDPFTHDLPDHGPHSPKKP